MKKRIGIQGFIIFAAVVLILFFPKYLFSHNRSGFRDYILNTAGIIMVLLGYLLRIAARGFKAQMNPDGKTLVVDGPYALTRNPMYLGTLLIGLGAILILFKWWVFFIFLIIYLSIYIPQINREEKVLSERFRDGFKQYCAKVPKFFPDANAISLALSKKYLQIKPSWVEKELPSLILTILFITGIKVWNYFRF